MTPDETATPTGTPAETSTPTATATPGIAQPGDVIINEIMPDPSAVLDEQGEWFEIYNRGATTFDLNGWIIKHNAGDWDKILSPGPLLLTPGQYFVLGINADAATNGGAPVDYQYTGFRLANTLDDIILLNASAMEIDRVVYDSNSNFPLGAGASMALISPNLDNSVGANWVLSAVTWPGSVGDRGSPGAANPPLARSSQQGHTPPQDRFTTVRSSSRPFYVPLFLQPDLSAALAN